MHELADLIEYVREDEKVSWVSGERVHRRGRYPFISLGGTHGNGRLVTYSSLVFCCSLRSFMHLTGTR